MAKTFPRDRFDDVPRSSRVGAHRAPTPRGRGWKTFFLAVLAAVVLIALGIFGLSVATDRLDLEEVVPGPTQETTTPTPTQTPTADPTTDPDALIQVLNGTTESGLAGSAKDELVAGGWTQANVTASNASDTDIEKTVVYYDDKELEGSARGVAEALGVTKVSYSTEFSSGEIPQVVVVLGGDYSDSDSETE